MASTIAGEIRVEMTPGEQAQLHSSRPVNLKAHEAYLQGRYHLQLAADALFKKDKGKFQSIEAEKAEEYFRQAIQEWPSCERAASHCEPVWPEATEVFENFVPSSSSRSPAPP